MFIHTCNQCNFNEGEIVENIDYDNHVFHSIYMGHPIEYGISKVTGKRHYHSNSWEADTLQAMRERIKDAERPVGGYPGEVLFM